MSCPSWAHKMGLFPCWSWVELVFVLYFVSLKQLFVPTYCCLLSHCCCVSWNVLLLQLLLVCCWGFTSLGPMRFCNIATVIIARHALLSLQYLPCCCCFYCYCNYCSFLISTKRKRGLEKERAGQGESFGAFGSDSYRIELNRIGLDRIGSAFVHRFATFYAIDILWKSCNTPPSL